MVTPYVPTTRAGSPRVTNGCSICANPTRAAFVNPLLQAGFAPFRIEREARTAGLAVKAETVTRHRQHSPVDGTPPPEPPPPLPALTPEETEQINAADFAEQVAHAAARNLMTGATRVTIADGLKATAILDKRAEKAENRRFLMNLAQLLSGGGQPAPKELIAGDAIDGEYVELDNPLLAPPELRE